MLDTATVLKQNDGLIIKTKDWPQILALLSASVASFSSGTMYAFASPAIPKLLSEYNFTIEEASYFPIVPTIAMILTTPIFCRLADKIGRKYTLLLAGVCTIISWVLMAFAKNVYVFYLSRIFFGICDASIFASLPTYIAEVTTPRVRSLYGNIIAVSSTFGQFLSNCIGFYCSIQMTAFIMLPFPILFIVSFLFMPETPYYLIMINKEDAARRSLQKVRDCEDVKDELKQIYLDVQRQLSESGKFKDLWLIKSNQKALIIANVSRVFQQMSGCGPLVVYAQYIFQEAGGDVSSGVAAMIVTGTFAIVNIFATIISDFLGRKRSMIISSLGCAIILFLEAIYFYLEIYHIVDLSAIHWFPILGITAYAMMYCIGLGVVPTLIMGEIFSTSIRKHAASVTNMAAGINGCMITKLFQVLMSSFGLWIPLLCFSFCCLLSAVVSYFIIPEMKGKTLEEIQQMLKTNK